MMMTYKNFSNGNFSALKYYYLKKKIWKSQIVMTRKWSCVKEVFFFFWVKSGSVRELGWVYYQKLQTQGKLYVFIETPTYF